MPSSMASPSAKGLWDHPKIHAHAHSKIGDYGHPGMKHGHGNAGTPLVMVLALTKARVVEVQVAACLW